MAVNEAKQSAGGDPSREIVAIRMYDAPRDLVFRMFTEREHVVRWWGPNGFTTTIEEMDVRAGGEWRFILHGPDGTDFKNRNIYREVAAPERLSYSHVSGPLFDAFVTFEEEEGGRTKLTMRMVFESAEQRDQVAEQYGAVEGLHQTLSRLADTLLNHPGSDATFTITRTFDAPRELVWRAWTDEKHLQQWFGPAGFDRVQYRNDFRAGGSLHYALRAPDGTEIWGKWIYREIAPPERLTFVMSFSNPEGGITRHPMSPTWPAETLSTITFSERDGKTTVTLTAIPINESTEERDTFVLGRPSMTQGWGGTFELLEKYLANERTAR